MNTGFILAALAAATSSHQLPPKVLQAVCYVESNYNANAIHKDDGLENSVGLCQMHLSTAKMMGYKGKEKGLFDPKVNAYYAGAYLKHLLNRYEGDIDKAIVAYNSGHYVKRKKQVYLIKVKKALIGIN